VITSTGMGTLGRVFCNIYNRKYFADGHITILQLKDESEASLITAILQSPLAAQQFEQRQRGSSGQIEIYPQDILNILIPKLPFEVQENVAKKWKEAVNLIEQSKSLYPEAEMELLERMGWDDISKNGQELYYINDYNELVNSERIDAEFYQPKYKRIFQLLNERGSMALGDLIKACNKGIQPEDYNNDGEVIVIKSKNVFGQGIELAKCERTSLEVLDQNNSKLSENDVVINSTGIGTLGRAGVVHCEIHDKIIAAVDLLIMKIYHNIIDPDYLVLFLNSPAGICQSEQQQIGSSGQVHIYPEHVRRFSIFIARNQNGEIDHYWQNKLGEKVRNTLKAKVDAQIILEQVKKLIMDSSLS
jgi:type I restriction enzyme, S subunit